MRALLYRFALVALLLSSVLSAHAGERIADHRLKKHLQGGISFSIVVGGPVIRKPLQLLKRKREVRRCSVRQASAIARGYGIRFQTIYRTPRALTVVGFKRGHKMRIGFSRALGCRRLS